MAGSVHESQLLFDYWSNARCVISHHCKSKLMNKGMRGRGRVLLYSAVTVLSLRYMTRFYTRKWLRAVGVAEAGNSYVGVVRLCP